MSNLRYPPYRRRDLFDVRQVQRRTKLTASQIFDALNHGDMPPPRFGKIPGAPVWLREDIEVWIAERKNVSR